MECSKLTWAPKRNRKKDRLDEIPILFSEFDGFNRQEHNQHLILHLPCVVLIILYLIFVLFGVQNEPQVPRGAFEWRWIQSWYYWITYWISRESMYLYSFVIYVIFSFVDHLLTDFFNLSWYVLCWMWWWHWLTMSNTRYLPFLLQNVSTWFNPQIIIFLNWWNEC